jgi:hypothetical protein
MAQARGIFALASSLAGLRPDDVTFVTLPWLPSGDGATIVPDSARADAIWAALAAEQPWPPPPTRGADGKRLTVAPDGITVDVHNATGQDGTGAQAATDLSAQGYSVGVVNARDRVSARTIIRHAPDQLEAARTLQASIPGSVLREDPEEGSRLDLTLGSTYGGVEPIRVKKPSSTTQATTADQDICTG